MTGRSIRRTDPAAAVLITALVALAYAGSFGGPFVLDDLPNIVENGALRSLWPPSVLFADAPPGVAGRPLITLSLALNWGVSGEAVWSYHAFNLLVHMLAALTLAALVRRSLLSPRLAPRFANDATRLATVTALIWALHPLQTQAVTYIIQRCESLMGLFFLLTFYAALRGWASPAGARRWHLAAVAAFLAGVGSKEVIAAAPPLLLLYDRMFVHPGWGLALRRSPLLYGGLALGLVLLAVQVAWAGIGALGLEELSITPAQYAITQPGVVLHYLRLALWPHPLVLDYQWPIASAKQALLPALALGVMLVLTILACRRARPAGFPGAWFFLILAPTSSVVPIRDLAFEHRIYLPLAAPVAVAVLGTYLLAQRRGGRAQAAWLAGWIALGLLLGGLTFARNRDYRSELAIWADTAAKRPLNAAAHLNLGAALQDAGRLTEARAHTERAVRLNPASPQARNNLGCLLAAGGDHAGARGHFEEAVRMDPAYPEARSNLGNVLRELGHLDDAVEQYRRAIDLAPGYAAARRGLAEALHARGLTLLGAGRATAALAQFREAMGMEPEWVSPRLAAAWVLATHPEASVRNPQRALQLTEEIAARSDREQPGLLDTMAAAHAAAGDFGRAVDLAQRALALARGAGQEALAGDILARLERYRLGQPYLGAASTRDPR